MPHEWRRDGCVISTDPAELDLDVVHGFLARSYWAAGITRDRVARAIAHSLAFGLYEGGLQIGFARVVTDYERLAFLADVFVLEAARGRGLGVWLVATVRAHPDLASIRRWLLFTADAHGLYARFGFAPLADPTRCLTIVDEALYDAPAP